MRSTGRSRRVTCRPARSVAGCGLNMPTTRHGRSAIVCGRAAVGRCLFRRSLAPTARRGVASSPICRRWRRGAPVGPKRVTLKSGEVRWEIRYNDAGRGSAYRRRRFERREDAQTFLDEMRRRRRLGELAESEWARRTVRELALDWWALHVLP